MKPFRLYFNQNKQWVTIRFLKPDDTRLEHCHAYYQWNTKRRHKRGLFGTLYIRNDWNGSRLDGLIVHELEHFVTDYFDEARAALMGKVTESFSREYKKSV